MKYRPRKKDFMRGDRADRWKQLIEPFQFPSFPSVTFAFNAILGCWFNLAPFCAPMYRLFIHHPETIIGGYFNEDITRTMRPDDSEIHLGSYRVIAGGITRKGMIFYWKINWKKIKYRTEILQLSLSFENNDVKCTIVKLFGISSSITQRV